MYVDYKSDSYDNFDHFLDLSVMQYRIRSYLLTNYRTENVENILTNLCPLFKLEKLTTTAYYLRTSELIERQHQAMVGGSHITCRSTSGIGTIHKENKIRRKDYL